MKENLRRHNCMKGDMGIYYSPWQSQGSFISTSKHLNPSFVNLAVAVKWTPNAKQLWL